MEGTAAKTTPSYGLKTARLGGVQKALVKWIEDGGYTYIGEGTQHHYSYGLGGRTLEEIQRSLDSLVTRGIVKMHKPGFYSMPGWEREGD
ncbi:hypothetical protein ASF29_18010 [Rhizobium sp. Leaf262]|nr:hypothetical protein ASF29_18010 [Rhizobium sp. Leaf262]